MKEIEIIRTRKIAFAAVSSAAAATFGYVSLSILAGMPRRPKIVSGKKAIACIGDSITFGAGVKWTRGHDSYPALLEKMLGKEHTVLNYGISGATLQRKGDKPYTKTDFWERAKAVKPELFLFMLGTNDSKPYNWNAKTYERELKRRLLELKAVKRNQHVYVMIPPAAFCGKHQKKVPFDIREDIIRNEIDGIIRKVAKNCRTGIIDLYKVTKGHPEYFADGVHPNELGNKIIARAVYGEICTAAGCLNVYSAKHIRTKPKSAADNLFDIYQRRY